MELPNSSSSFSVPVQLPFLNHGSERQHAKVITSRFQHAGDDKMTNLELSPKRVQSTNPTLLEWCGGSRIFKKLLTLFRCQHPDIKALYCLSDRELADLGLARGKLETMFRMSETSKSGLDHLKRGFHLNGGEWN